MKLEINKGNIDEMLSDLAKDCERYYGEEKEKKLKPQVEAILERLGKVELKLPERRIIEIKQGRVSEMAKNTVPEESITFKEQGFYNFFYYYDSKEDKNYFSLKEVEANVPNYYITGSYSTITHYIYDEELDILLGVTVSIKTKTEENPVTHFEPSKNSFLVFTREKNLYTISKNAYRYVERTASTYTYSNNNFDDNYAHSGLLTEFQKMFAQPIMNVGANNFVTMDSLDGLIQLSGYKAKLEIKSGPKQKKIDELTAIELKPADVFEMKSYSTVSYPHAKTRVEKVKENTCVVRWMLYGYNSPVQCDGLRIYIEGKDVHACKLNNNGQFIRTTISTIKPENFLSSDMCEVDKEDLKGTILEYYGEIINDIPEKFKSILMITFIKEPKVEQLFKMGFEDLIYAALNSQEYDIVGYICSHFNVPKSASKEKNVFKFLGVNKYQFGKYKELIAKESKRTDKHLSLFKYIKSIFNGNEISFLDNKTFDEIYGSIVKLIDDNPYSYWRDDVYQVTWRAGQVVSNIKATENENLYKSLMKILPKILDLGYYDIGNYVDYISMVKVMDDFKNFKIGFDNKDEVRQMHDAAAAIYNLKREEFRTKEFVAQLKKVEKLEYENKDDEFCVVIPTEPGDLAKEGLELHHCVKNYIDKVAKGMTNIVFIRKKSDKTKPFFTVEVSNDKTIEQVHGFGNRNANTEPGLEEFVKRWAGNKRLKVNAINKVR